MNSLVSIIVTLLASILKWLNMCFESRDLLVWVSLADGSLSNFHSRFPRYVEWNAGDTKWTRAWRERRLLLPGLFLRVSRACTPFTNPKKKRDCLSLILLRLFSLNSCKVAFFPCSDVDTPDCAALKLIDFGRSIDMKLFPAGTTFSANCYTEDFQCIEMKEGRAWTTQVQLTSAILSGTV